MEKADNELSFQAFGALVHVITKSSPAAMVFWFYAVFSFISFLASLMVIWTYFSIILGLVLIFLWVFKPDRLWSERHTLEMKKLDMTLLGDKKNPQVTSQEYVEIYQPIKPTETQKKK